MAAGITIRQGKSQRHAIPVLNAFDPTGWSVRSQVRRNVNSNPPLHEWSTALGTAAFVMVAADELIAGGFTPPGDVDEWLCVVLTTLPATSTAWGDSWELGVADIEAYRSASEVIPVGGTFGVTVQLEVTR